MICDNSLVQKLLVWIKTNKLTTILILILLYTFLSNYGSPFGYDEIFESDYAISDSLGFAPQSAKSTSSRPSPIAGGGTPRLDIQDRKVSTNSTMSLVVSDVRDAIKSITSYASSSGGYMVNASQTSPEGLANGNISIRVPADRLEATLEFLRDTGVKVVSESIIGRDLTDQYMDVEARLNTLEGTKLRYEAILNQAVDVDEILRVTQHILNTQDQIDNLKGQLAYLDATSKSSLITVYLSTDEFELPYSPDEPWRPSVIFKYAVRGMVGALQGVGGLLIWVGVYSVIWIPLLLVTLYLRKRAKRQPPISNN